MKQPLEAPVITIRNDRKEIDLELLGDDDLETVIKYTDIEENDFVDTVWSGADPDGNSFDSTGRYPVGAGGVATGIKVPIDKEQVKAVKGGEAFYSYSVMRDGLPFGKSLRVFSFIGVRVEEKDEEGLPVALAVESHGLVIKPNTLDAAGVTFVVAPYQALQINNKITFTFQGFDEDGYKEKPVVLQLEVKKEHLDSKAITFSIGKSDFRDIEGGRAEVKYSVDLGDGKGVESPVQTFMIDADATLPDYLPHPVILGHTPGEALDPRNFRDGLTIRLVGYPGMEISDHVTFCWHSPVRDYFQTVRVDATTKILEGVTFHVPFSWLAENQGAGVNLTYLFAREGAGQRSLELRVDIATMRELSAPLVINASPDEPKDSGTVEALDVPGGVWVQIPNVLSAGERAVVEWRGWPGLGDYIADKPEPSNPLRFHIPVQYVPANMGRGPKDESRRFEVIYKVIGEGKPGESDPYHLRIKPYPTTRYPRIDCTQMQAGKLSLADVPSEGADLELETWTYSREGNLIELSITGVAAAGGDLNETIRDASQPVSSSEASDGVVAKLDRDILKNFKLDADFTLRVRLSFDGGAHYWAFPTLPVRLVP